VKSFSDTIAAISTATGDAGISIVRVSGPESFSIADRIFRCDGDKPSMRPGGTFVHGFVRTSKQGGKADADEVILLIYRAPGSYTKEDVIELQGHGGRECARRILRAVLEAGARPAEPGEFTRRAFLNGRIDLLQAEAVADLICAKSDRAASAAIDQLEGSLSVSFSAIYSDLIDAAGSLESSLDFSEDDLPVSLFDNAQTKIESARKALKELLSTWEEGHLLREGALVVISGKPNVGKSTLLNSLLGTNRAIVTEEPGTTRDTIEEQLVLDGVPLRIVDTAGIRESANTAEREGIQRAQDLIRRADLNLLMYDCSVKVDPAEKDYISKMDPRKIIIILNKTDLGEAISPSDLNGYYVIPASLINGNGVQEIKNAIAEKLGTRNFGQPHATISERHRHVILEVLSKLDDTTRVLLSKRDDLLVPAISSLRETIENLGSITGKSYDKSLLDNIFGRFCIGK